MPAAVHVESRTRHRRVTLHRRHRGAVLGMYHPNRVTTSGNTTHFEVSYLTALGSRGAALAQALLDSCERDYATLQAIFGGLTPKHLPFVVQVTADNSGASHSSCMGTDIAVGANSGPTVDLIRSLLVAEADEVFMANFGRGWNCGGSNGEGLSRVLANDMYPGAQTADFVTANDWLDIKARPNWVSRNDSTDVRFRSIGCSVLFLNWLRFQLGYAWPDIVAAGAGTLSATYLHLTGKRSAWKDFQAFMNAHFPPGKKYHLRSDNPFPV